MLKKKRSYDKFIDILFVLLGLSSPLGERVNEHFPHLSQLYVIVGLIIVIFSLFNYFSSKRNRVEKISKAAVAYATLVLFIFFHNLVIFLQAVVSNSNIDFLNLYKQTIFMVISLAFVLQSVEKKKRISLFIFGFNLSFALVFLFLNNFTFYNNVIRAEGAYTNANSFAFDAMFVVFTSIFLLVQKKKLIHFSTITLLIGIVALFLSGTRSALIGTTIGLIYYLLSNKQVHEKIKGVITFAVISFIILLIFPKELLHPTLMRLIHGDSNISGFLNNIRLKIWLDYSRSWKEFIGYGIPLEIWRSINIRDTHNTFLYIIVRYGLFGLITYLALLYSSIKEYFDHGSYSKKDSRIIFSLMISMSIISLFFDALSIKTFWIIWSLVMIFSVYRNRLKDNV